MLLSPICSIFEVFTTASNWRDYFIPLISPIIGVGGAVWIAFCTTKKQIEGQRKLEKEKQEESWDLIRLSYLTSLDTVINEMKSCKKGIPKHLKNLDDVDYEFHYVPIRSAGAYAILSMNYNDLHNAFASISLKYNEIMVKFTNSFESVYSFKVDIEQLEEKTNNYLNINSKIKQEIADNISNFLPIIKSLRFENNIDQDFVSKLISTMNPYYNREDLDELSLNIFKACMDELFSKVTSIPLNNIEKLDLLILSIKNIGNKFAILTNETTVYKASLNVIKNNFKEKIEKAESLKPSI